MYQVHVCIYYRCGHCKKLAPELERAAEILKEADPPVAIAKVDATEDNDLAQRYMEHITHIVLHLVIHNMVPL